MALQWMLGILLFCSSVECFEKIHVVYTSAIVPPCFETRKHEYIRSIQLLKSYNYEPYIFESCHPFAPSFFNDNVQHVFYSNVNDDRLRNKGVNEARSLLAGIHHYRFDDHDMIVKITGRYQLESDEFLKLIEDHPEVDAFMKCDPHFPAPLGKVFTGCFALRCDLFKEMLESLDLQRMENEMIDFEIEVAQFAQKLSARGGKVMYVNRLGLSANIGVNCPPAISHW